MMIEKTYLYCSEKSISDQSGLIIWEVHIRVLQLIIVPIILLATLIWNGYNTATHMNGEDSIDVSGIDQKTV